MHIVSLSGEIAPESGKNWRVSIIHDVALAIMTPEDTYAKTSSIVWKLDVGKKAKDMWGELS